MKLALPIALHSDAKRSAVEWATPRALALAAVVLAFQGPEAAASEPLEISGYLQPQFGVRFLPDEVPRDRWDAGMQASTAGIDLSGMPVTNFCYSVQLVVGGTIDAVDRVTATDSNNDGNTDAVTTTTRRVVGIAIEEASVTYRPHAAWDLKGGQMRIPFTAQHQSPATALMFSARSGPNEVFLSGTDLGALLIFHPYSERVRVSAGVFNGDLLSTTPQNERGILYSFRADVNPLGAFPFGESDRARGPFRIGVGAGMLYHPALVYDDTGFGARRVDDARVSASLRLAFRGAYLQSEALRRQVDDELTNRPETSTGGYAQGAFLFGFGVEPVARFGVTVQSENVAPRRVLYREMGINWYPHPKDDRIESLKISAQYQGEDRVTERERAHGFSLGLQLVW